MTELTKTYPTWITVHRVRSMNLYLLHGDLANDNQARQLGKMLNETRGAGFLWKGNAGTNGRIGFMGVFTPEALILFSGRMSSTTPRWRGSYYPLGQAFNATMYRLRSQETYEEERKRKGQEPIQYGPVSNR